MSDPSIDLESTVEARSDLFTTTVSDDLVIFDPEQGTYFGSGLVGQEIWGIIAQPKSAKSVCDALLEEFDIDRKTCETQVLEFLSELNARGLIKVS